MDDICYNPKGFHASKPGELLELHIIEHAVRETFFRPDDDEIENLCRKYGFDHAYTWQVIRDALSTGAHTVVIEADVYRRIMSDDLARSRKVRLNDVERQKMELVDRVVTLGPEEIKLTHDFLSKLSEMAVTFRLFYEATAGDKKAD